MVGGEPWARLPLLAVGLALTGGALGALGALIGGVAREARTASLVSVLVVLPIVFLGLIPSEFFAAAGWVSDALPFAHGVRFFSAALFDIHPWGSVARESGWLVGARPALRRRFGARRAYPSSDELVPGHEAAAAAPDRRAARSRARDEPLGRRPRPAALRRARGACRTSACPALQRHTVDGLVRECEELVALGVKSVLLFGIPESKDDEGSGAWIDDGIVQQALRALRPRFPELVLLTDVCLCEYTSHGHCGVLDDDGEVDNDASLELLARTAVSHVEAGADVVCPSDMMDGRVAAIRAELPQTPIVAYSAKYASAFYGPFRDAAGSAPAFGDRRGYQLDPGNVREALRECELDVAEGADVLLVKPALPYLDVRARRARPLRPAARRLQRLGRVRDGEGRRGGRRPRRAGRGRRVADRDPPRRRRHRDHVLGEGLRAAGSRE